MSYQYRPFGAFRLFLAFFVVLQHFVANAAPLGAVYSYVKPFGLGDIAVLVFFCLSGFVITEAATLVYADKPFAYLVNRFLRIVPHFLVALLIAVLLHAWFQHYGTLRLSDREHPDLPTMRAFDLKNVFLNVFGFLPGVNRFLTFDFVDIIWAVRVEMVFYIAVFVSLLIPKRFQWSVLTPYLLVVLALATLLVARQFGYSFFFIYGVLLYKYQRYPLSLALCVVGMGLYFFLFLQHVGPIYYPLATAQYSILGVLIAAMTWLALKPGKPQSFDQKCGELSYPLYIHHQNVLILMISLTAGYSYTVFAIGIVASFVASYGLMLLVDPAVNRLRIIVRGSRLDHSTNQAWPGSAIAIGEDAVSSRITRTAP